MKFTLEIELGNNDAIANRSDLERALLRVAGSLALAGISQGFSARPQHPVEIIGEQGLRVGKWEVVEMTPFDVARQFVRSYDDILDREERVPTADDYNVIVSAIA